MKGIRATVLNCVLILRLHKNCIPRYGIFFKDYDSDVRAGWNFLMRVYLPRQSVIDGTYKLPVATRCPH
jgi:hypothetical protein